MGELNNLRGLGVKVETGLPQDGDTGRVGDAVLEQRQTLGYQFRAEERKSGDVATGAGEACHETINHGIAEGKADNRYLARCSLSGAGR